MHVPFGVAHGDLRCRRHAMLDQRDTNQKDGKPARANCFHHSMILIDNNRQTPSLKVAPSIGVSRLRQVGLGRRRAKSTSESIPEKCPSVQPACDPAPGLGSGLGLRELLGDGAGKLYWRLPNDQELSRGSLSTSGEHRRSAIARSPTRAQARFRLHRRRRRKRVHSA